ncbi:hypothetical protein ScPMuIL_009273 [Solemya velum]
MYFKEWLVFFWAVYLGIVSARYHVKTFRSREDTNFSKLVIDRNTEKIYIGGVNRLFKLSSRLELEQTANTGPHDDNPNCHHPFSTCKLPLKMSNSFSKALVIDYTGQRLIACSSLFQGFCERRLLSDITVKDDDFPTPVVTNNATASTVAFIAQGPAEDDAQQSDVLYVGATWTKTGLAAYRDLVPAFCSRKLDGTYDLAYKSITTSSKKEIESQHRELFPVHYIFGFASDNFSYMVTIQKINTHKEQYVSKLVRVCQNDKNFYSYAEVELICQYNGATYNLVQAAYVGHAGSVLAETMGIPTTEDVFYAVFSMGNPSSPVQSPTSALCVYPLRQIRRIFTQNIKHCFEGQGNTGPDHMVQPDPCSLTEFPIDDNYCGTYDINTPISGPEPITAEAGTILNVSTSSIAVSITHRYTVAFIGTTRGHIQKVSIESQILATTYEDIVVEAGTAILADMHFDLNRKHLLVMTEKALHKLKVQNCDQYKTCAECLGVQDPYCGWCSLEDKCSLRSECNDHDSDLRWLSYSGQTCPSITWVKPHKIQKEANRRVQLELNISNLPTFGGNYVCTFSYRETTLAVPASRSVGNIILCETPQPHLLPPIPTGEDHIIMRLTVQMDAQGFVWTNFTFFDCSLHESCTSCLLSDFPCNWCIQNHMCTQNLNNCVGNSLVTDAQKPEFCPRIDSDTTEILVPSSTRKKISVRALNLPNPDGQIECFFTLKEGIRVIASVTKISDASHRVECASVEFTFIGDTPHRNVPFQIIWGDNKPLDNPENVQVRMYKCDAMAENCGGCLTKESKYMCGWCKTSCSIQKDCPEDWLSRTSICPNPEILDFHPKTGVKSGGTLLTIEGENLGKDFDNIVGGVDVAGVTCRPIRELYIRSERIVCETGATFVQILEGHVRVIVNSKYLTVSQQKFHYVEPRLEGISPSYGPKSGGTVIQLFGDYLNAATNITVSIGKLPCPVVSKSPNMLKCITQQSNDLRPTNLEVHFDKQHNKTSIAYTYVANPNITAVEPMQTIFSGGTSVFVSGKQLNSILKPIMRLFIETEAIESECKTINSTTIHCWSPYVADRLSQMVKAYQSSKNDYLIIDGENLNRGISKEDVTVMIGTAYCNVTSIGNQLTCRPPKYQPRSK